MIKKLHLPPLCDGSRPELPLDGRRVVIIGANGSGKTRFTEYLIEAYRDFSIHLTALDALYTPEKTDVSPGSVDELYHRAVTQVPFLRNDMQTRLDKALALLLCEELQTLMSHKIAVADGRADASQPLVQTRLDILSQTWKSIFPGNRILRNSGRVTFANTADDTAGYSSVRLSNGEKAVLYAIAVALLAPSGSLIFVDSPGLFLHASVTSLVWTRLQELRPDCHWIFTTHDVDFLSDGGIGSDIIWVRGYDAGVQRWDYTMLPPDAALSDEMYVTLIGARSPVLFIEGDGKNSIDARLYPLVFRDYTVRSLGSCDKVVEATRTFNDLNQLHHLNSRGIVDRDRRDDREVAYLRRRRIFVPEVAEIENILMLEDVIRTVAARNGRSPQRAFSLVKRKLIGMFRGDLKSQALQHTRHRVKRLMECRADGRFNDINALEEHVRRIIDVIRPRHIYEELCREFSRYVAESDYASILRVYNQKSMLVHTNVAGLCGIEGGKDEYINTVIEILKDGGEPAECIRHAVVRCFGLDAADVRPEIADLTDEEI